mgnify:CR=1 FL=1
MEDMHKKIGSLEAVLFAHGEGLPRHRVAELLQITEKELEPVIEQYAEMLDTNEERGLALLMHKNNVQLVTHPRHESVIQELLRDAMSQDLGPAALETLALIAYFGPITRSRIDYVRGVNSAFSLRTLLVRGLIERSKQRGTIEYVYTTSSDLLKDLGITNREDLPDFEELSSVLEKAIQNEEQEKTTNE